MSRFLRARVFVALCAFVVISVLPASAQPPLGSDPDPERILTPAEALRLQAEHYAADFGVSVIEAERRLLLQPFISELAARLTDNERAVFAAVRAEHTPEFRVIVQVTPGGEDRVPIYVLNGPLAGLVEVQVVQWTEAELMAQQEETTRTLLDLDINSSSEVMDQEVLVYVTDVAQLDARLQEAGRELPSTVTVREVPDLGTGEFDLLGGLALSTCTSGFAGKSTTTGYQGVFTAAHCGDVQHYAGVQLNYVAERWKVDADFQLNRQPAGHNLRNIVWIGNNTWITINSLYWRSQHYHGQQVCKMGMTTGYNCGVVESRAYTPSCKTNKGVLVCFNNSFIHIGSTNGNLSSPGDSGGPWFGASGAQRHAAFGLHHDSHDEIDDDAIYQPIDPIYAYPGFQLLLLADCGSDYYC